MIPKNLKTDDKENIRQLLIAELPELIAQHWPHARTDGSGWRVGNMAGESGGSLSLNNEGLWHDFATGESGDIFDFVRVLHNLPEDFSSVMEWARERYNMPQARSTVGSSKRANNVANSMPKLPAKQAEVHDPKAPNPEAYALFLQQAQAALSGDTPEARKARAYLKQRGLLPSEHFGVVDSTVTAQPWTDDASRGYRKALHGRLLIMYQSPSGELEGFNARDLTGTADDGFKYLKPRGKSTVNPFNAGAINRAKRAEVFILTEGELDAASVLTALGNNYPVIGCTGGTLPKGWPKRIAEASSWVLILADDDGGIGRNKAEELRAEIQAHTTDRDGSKVLIATLPGHKDASECLQELGAGKLAALISEQIEAAKAERVTAVSDYQYLTVDMLAELDARARREHTYYSTGIAALDDLLGGGYLEGLHLLGGITGGGKTSLALHIATHNAQAGRPVIFASYEQSRLELWARIASRVTGVPQRAIKAGTFNEHGRELLTSTKLRGSKHWHELEQLARYLNVIEGGDALSRRAGGSIELLAEQANIIANVHGAPPLIIIDYLQRVPVDPQLGIRDVRERVGAVAGQLQVTLGRELTAPVLALSSVGRASYNAENFAKAPLDERMTAFKEAGELEYTSYTSLLLYGLPAVKEGQVMRTQRSVSNRVVALPRTLDLVKNREGYTGRVAAMWEPGKDQWGTSLPYGRDNDAL